MASSNTMATSNSLSPASLVSTSFHLLRSNPKQTLLLLFLSLLPSSLSPFSSYLPINPLLLESFSFPYRPTYAKVFDYYISHLNINCTTKLISTIFLCFFLCFILLAPTLRTLYLMATSTSKSHLKSSLSIFSTRLCVVALDLTYKCLLFMLLYLELRYLPSISVLSPITAFFGFLFGEFLRLVWVLSLVAAVDEGDRSCGGFAAVKRAVELVVMSGNDTGKYGRYWQLLTFSAYMYLFTDLLIHVPYDLALIYIRSGVMGRAVSGVVLVAVVGTMSLLTLAAQVTLYCELKKSSEEEGDYTNLASSSTMPISLPSNSLYGYASSLVSTSFHLLRSNPKQTLPLLFVSLLPSSISPFSSYLSINPLLLESFSFPYRLTYTNASDYGISHLTINCSTKLISTIFLCFFLSFIPLAPTLRTLYLMTTSTSKSHLKAILSTFSARLCVVALDLTYKCLLFMLLYLELRYLPSIFVLSLSTAFFGFYLGEFLRLVWVLSLVAAVDEEDRCCGGVSAVRRAVELVVSANGTGKYGRRQILGFSLYMYLCTDLAIYGSYDIALIYLSSSGVVGRAVWGVVLVAVVGGMSLLTLAAQVVLYCELKKSSEEEGDYTKLAADDPIRVNGIDD